MATKIDTLRAKRDDLLERQRQATMEIVHNSIDPVRGTFLANELVFTSSEHRELTRLIDSEIDRRRIGWWERFWNQ